MILFLFLLLKFMQTSVHPTLVRMEEPAPIPQVASSAHVIGGILGKTVAQNVMVLTLFTAKKQQLRQTATQ